MRLCLELQHYFVAFDTTLFCSNYPYLGVEMVKNGEKV